MAFKVGAVVGEAILKTAKWTSGAAVIQKGAKKLGGALATAAKVGFVALSAALVKSTFEANKFQKEFANVTTLIEGTKEDFADISTNLLKLDSRLGTTTELTQGLYQALSAGAEDAAAGMVIVEESARFSIAALTDNATAVDVLTTAMNAYGSDVVSAAQASDIFFTTIKQGKITGEQLSATIGQSIPLFASTGIALEELSAGMAAMTKQGVSASESTTQLNAIVNSFLAPTEKMSAALSEMGFESGAAFLETEGLAGALKLAEEQTGGNATELKALMGNLRGMKGMMALTGVGGREFTKILGEMENATGATDEAFEKQEITFRTLGNEFNKTQIIVGNISKLFADKFAVAIQGVLEKFNQFMISAEGLAFTETIIEKLTKTWEVLKKALGEVAKLAVDAMRGFAGMPKIVKIVAAAVLVLVPAVVALNVALGPVGLALAAMAAAAFLVAAAVGAQNEEVRIAKKLEEGLAGAINETVAASGSQEAQFSKAIKVQKNTIDVKQKQLDLLKRIQEEQIGVNDLTKDESLLLQALPKNISDVMQAQNNLNSINEDGVITFSATEQATIDTTKAQKLMAQEIENLGKEYKSTQQKQADFVAAGGDASDKLKKNLKRQTDAVTEANEEMLAKLAAAQKKAIDGVGNTTDDAEKKYKTFSDFVAGELKTFADKFKFTFDIISQAVSLAFQGMSDISSQFYTNEFAKLENANNADNEAMATANAAEQAALQKNFNDGLISQAEFDTAKLALDKTQGEDAEELHKEQLKKENDLKLKQFKANQSFAIANIWLSLAQAVMGFWAAYGAIRFAGPIIAGSLTTLATGLAVAQTVLVGQQEFVPAMAEGGTGSGLTQINEEGGELQILKDGTKIIPNDISRDIAASLGGGGEINVSFAGANIANDMSLKKITRYVAAALGRELRTA